MSEISVHGLLRHQIPWRDSPARFKVLRCGRRTGKDAFAENVSLLGHGPEINGRPKFKGLQHGRDVVWLAPTIPQAAALWKNEVEPRFRNREPQIVVNKVEHTVTLLNRDGSPYATLWVRSAEAISGLRGIGKQLGGIIINEAAHMDLETVWRDVIRPTLMDCEGWAIIMSTTNGGPDGFENEAGKRSPSFFNIICEEIQQGKRSEDWVEFYGTAADNPKISAAEFNALVEEYPTDSVKLAEEVFAKLVVGGAGVAFPEWADDVHKIRFEPSAYARWTSSGDWGWNKGVLHLYASEHDHTLCRSEWVFEKKLPYEVGYEWVLRCLRFKILPEWITIDTPPVSNGPTILAELQRGSNDALKNQVDESVMRPVWLNPPKGSGSRETKKTEVHALLRYVRLPDGKVPPGGEPRMRFHPDCTDIVTILPKLPKDPHGKPDVDTNADDHGYDSLAAWAMTQVQTPSNGTDAPRRTDPDAHPGWDWEKGKVKEYDNPWSKIIETQPEGGPRWTRFPEGAR